MKAALIKVREAMAQKNIIQALTAMLVRDGVIYTSDGRMTAAAPFPHDGPFLVPGEEFSALVERMADDALLTVHDDSVVLRSGRTRGTVRTLPLADRLFVAPEAPWATPPPGLLAAFTKVRPFISDNATQPWALCVNLVQGGMVATTNIALIFVALPELLPPDNTLLPCWAIDFVLKRREALVGWILEPTYIAFKWEDGSWLRTQLINGAFPDTIARMLGTLPAADVFITPEWRAAWGVVAELADDWVEVTDTVIKGKRGLNTDIEQQAVLPALEGHPTAWTLRYTNPVIAVATHWSPINYPAPVSFIGDGVRGLIVGRQR